MRRVAKVSVRFISSAFSRIAQTGSEAKDAPVVKLAKSGARRARRRSLAMASAGDPLELTRRRAEADALAAECERLRAARELLTAHMSRLLPPADVSASFPGVADDHEASTVADEASETMSMASHAMSTMSHTTGTTAVTAKSRGGKSVGGASRRSRRKKKSGRSSSLAAAAARLSSRDRRVLASTEVEHLEKQIELERVAEEKKLDGMRASLEETNARTQSATKALCDFERDVVAASVVAAKDAIGATAVKNAGFGFVSAEKWCKHVESLTTSKRAETEQLALKTSSCRTRRRGLEQSLRQKERAGETLTAVDHETLLIERNRRVERLELRNTELRRLAGVASRAADQLAKCKVELEEKSAEGQFLKADMAAKRVMIVSFDVLMIAVKAEHAKMAKINKDLHVAGSSGDNPPVGEYVRVKDTAHALEQKVKDAERKLELAKAKRRAADAKNATRRLLGRGTRVT
jgi:hypothetical protein